MLSYESANLLKEPLRQDDCTRAECVIRNIAYYLQSLEKANYSRNSAQHNYAKETEELAKSNQTDQAGAQVLLAQIRQEDQTLKSLEALQAAGGAFLAPSDGIVTEMALTVGADTPAVAGLLAANEQEYA